MILDIPVILPPDDLLEFGEQHLGHGLQSTEEELPGDATGLYTHQSTKLPVHSTDKYFPL